MFGTISRAVLQPGIAFGLACAAAGANAQLLEDHYWATLSGFWPSISSTARADWQVTGRPGTVVSFEDDLGLPDRKVLPDFQAGMRVGERWRIEFEYYGLNRAGTRTLSRDIAWDDTVFPASASLSTEFDSDVFRIGAGWSFVKSPTAELGGVLGLHVTRFRFRLNGQVSLGNASVGTQVEQKDATIPLPTIGLYGALQLSPGWYLTGRVDYFSLSSGDYDGGLVNATAGLSYFVTRNIGVGLGYRYVDYSLELTRANWVGAVDYRFSGPVLSLEVGF